MAVVDRVQALLPDDLFKLLRYAAVSAISVPFTQVLFWVLLQTDLREFVANLIAVGVSTVPNYLLNRYWVWQKQGKNSVRREIIPFWSLTFLGMALSATFVWLASKATDIDLVLMLASIAAFGIVWVFKFFVLEKVLFAGDEQTSEAVVADTARG